MQPNFPPAQVVNNLFNVRFGGKTCLKYKQKFCSFSYVYYVILVNSGGTQKFKIKGKVDIKLCGKPENGAKYVYICLSIS